MRYIILVVGQMEKRITAGIWLLVMLNIIHGIIYISMGIFLLYVTSLLDEIPFIGFFIQESIDVYVNICFILNFSIGLFYLFLAHGLTQLESWARTMTITITFLSLVFGAFFTFIIPGVGCFIFLVIFVIGIFILWYLSRQEIKELFREEYNETEDDEDEDLDNEEISVRKVRRKNPSDKATIPEKIRRLKKLRDDDVITDEDFEEKKQELLGRY